MRRLAALVLAACLTLALAPAQASAFDLRPLKGHVSDPDHLLSNHDRSDIDDKLTKLQKDTWVAVTILVMDLPEDTDFAELGHEAFAKWKIGAGVDNSLLVVIPRTGHSHVHQEHAPPQFTKKEAISVASAEKPNTSVADRAQAIVTATSDLLRLRAMHRRPRGTIHKARGIKFLSAFAALLALMVLLTIRANKPQPTFG